MKKRNNTEKPVKAADEIQEIINAIPSNIENPEGEKHINIIHNEFLTFPGKISIPRIPVTELNHTQGLEIIKNLAPKIPEYLKNHRFLKIRIPAAEQHSLHFHQKIEGKCIDFSHMFKIDFKFGGNPENITKRGNSDYYPAFDTDRIYYKSKLIPESTIHRLDEKIIMDPIRIKEADEVDSDQFFHTFAIFDEADRGKVTEIFYQMLELPEGTLGISPALYPFIDYDYFTACFNVLNPTPHEIARAVEIFEPLFLLLYGKLRNIKNIVNSEAIQDFYGHLLRIKGTIINPTDQFNDILRDYFTRYKLVRNDDMVIKGWWKFEEI